jgi:sulfur dioxygenase
VHGVEDYAALMASLRLPDPKMMDVAVPANMRQGLHQEEVARRGWAYSTDEAKGCVGTRVALIDLREKAERDRAGTIRVRCTPPTPICRTISTTAASSMSSQ